MHYTYEFENEKKTFRKTKCNCSLCFMNAEVCTKFISIKIIYIYTDQYFHTCILYGFALAFWFMLRKERKKKYIVFRKFFVPEYRVCCLIWYRDISLSLSLSPTNLTNFPLAWDEERYLKGISQLPTRYRWLSVHELYHRDGRVCVSLSISCTHETQRNEF